MRQMVMLLMALWGSWAMAVEPIADVRSLRQLHAAAYISAGREWDVKLGLGDSGEQGGPWAILYCWATYHGTEQTPRLGGAALAGNPLGPLYVQVAWDGRPIDKPTPRVPMKVSLKDSLYSIAIPLAWKGQCQITVCTSDGRPIAQREVTVNTVRACYWQTFAAPAYEALGRADMRIDTEPAAAMPAFFGLAAVLRPGAEIAPELMDANLPGSVPLADEWIGASLVSAQAGHAAEMIEIRLQGNVLTVDSAHSTITNRLDAYMLARWWVNGKPVPAVARLRHMQVSGMVTPADSVRVEFRLPSTLGKVVAGDKIGLQLLYAPGAIMIPSPQASEVTALGFGVLRGKGRTCMAPMLSNRLEFTAK